jgi:hypothetical protein
MHAKGGTIADFVIGEEGLRYDQGDSSFVLNKDILSIGYQGDWLGLSTDSQEVEVNRTNKNDNTVMRVNRFCAINHYYDGSGYEPMIELNEKSSFPSVAISTNGATICNGGLINLARFIDLSKDEENVLHPLKATTFIVKSRDSGQEGVIYLPTKQNMFDYLNIQNATFAFPMKVVCAYSSAKSIKIYFQGGDSTLGFVDWNGGSNYNTELNKGDCLDFLLIFDGENYYAQITSRSV